MNTRIVAFLKALLDAPSWKTACLVLPFIAGCLATSGLIFARNGRGFEAIAWAGAAIVFLALSGWILRVAPGRTALRLQQQRKS